MWYNCTMKRRTKVTLRRAFAAAVLVAVALFLVRLLDGGVSNRDVDESVHAEAATLRDVVNARADAIDAKLGTLAGGEVAIDTKLADVDAKLTRVEEKLDALLRLADRPLPDGMKKAE